MDCALARSSAVAPGRFSGRCGRGIRSRRVNGTTAGLGVSTMSLTSCAATPFAAARSAGAKNPRLIISRRVSMLGHSSIEPSCDAVAEGWTGRPMAPGPVHLPAVEKKGPVPAERPGPATCGLLNDRGIHVGRDLSLRERAVVDPDFVD